MRCKRVAMAPPGGSHRHSTAAANLRHGSVAALRVASDGWSCMCELAESRPRARVGVGVVTDTEASGKGADRLPF
jgi:hypothetical protein